MARSTRLAESMYEFMKDISLRDNGDPTAGTGSEDHVALSHVSILSMHVSSMVVDARFGRAAACCFDTNP